MQAFREAAQQQQGELGQQRKQIAQLQQEQQRAQEQAQQLQEKLAEASSRRTTLEGGSAVSRETTEDVSSQPEAMQVRRPAGVTPQALGRPAGCLWLTQRPAWPLGRARPDRCRLGQLGRVCVLGRRVADTACARQPCRQGEGKVDAPKQKLVKAKRQLLALKARLGEASAVLLLKLRVPAVQGEGEVDALKQKLVKAKRQLLALKAKLGEAGAARDEAAAARDAALAQLAAAAEVCCLVLCWALPRHARLVLPWCSRSVDQRVRRRLGLQCPPRACC